jgi:hypothetical protein
MIDSKILESNWVEPKKTGWGHQVKKDAPENIKQDFAQYEAQLKKHREKMK